MRGGHSWAFSSLAASLTTPWLLPKAHAERALGGSATYGGLSRRFLQRHMTGRETGLVGVVGEDFADEDRQILADAGLDLYGLETAEGETFRWEVERITVPWPKPKRRPI